MAQVGIWKSNSTIWDAASSIWLSDIPPHQVLYFISWA